MRRAKIVAASFEVLCPACSAPIASPYDGSHLWTTDDLDRTAAPGGRTLATCECGTTCEVRPAVRVVLQ